MFFLFFFGPDYYGVVRPSFVFYFLVRVWSFLPPLFIYFLFYFMVIMWVLDSLTNRLPPRRVEVRGSDPGESIILGHRKRESVRPLLQEQCLLFPKCCMFCTLSGPVLRWQLGVRLSDCQE